MTRALLVVAALANIARAESIARDEPLLIREERTSWDRLGTTLRDGLVVVDGTVMTTMGIGVLIDRPIAARWRGLAEYEHLWLGPYDYWNDVGVASLAHSAHRVHLGIRRELGERRLEHSTVRLFVDLEAGGGAMLVDRAMGSSLGVAHAFAGVRGGAAFVWNERRIEYEFVLRGLASTEGPGVLFGIGVGWGE